MIEVSFLKNYASMQEALIDLTSLSKGQLKKQGATVAFLKREVEKRRSYKIPLNIVNYLRISSEYSGPEIEIIYEDNFFTVLNCPANVHCHPLKYSDTNNCLSFLSFRGESALLSVNSNSYDRGLLNRIDFGTSGVLIYIKKEEDYYQFREKFNELVTQKIYLAVVENEFSFSGVQRVELRSSGVRGQKIVVADKDDLDAQSGELTVNLIKYVTDKNLSLLKIYLKSGLRHQIRAQLSHLGHPLLGDTLYGGAPAQRSYLHAYLYEIIHPVNGQKYTFKCLPEDLFSGLFDFDCCL